MGIVVFPTTYTADSCPNCNSPDGLKIVRNIVVNGYERKYLERRVQLPARSTINSFIGPVAQLVEH